MAQTTVDARGKLCPEPLIMTKRALAGLAVGRSMTVLIDNDTSRQNVERFLRDNNAHCEVSTAGSVHTLTVTRLQEELPAPNAESYCAAEPRKPHIIAFRRDKMGSGSDELGEILVKAFVNTIKEVTPLPSAMLFYNSGVHLVVEGSPLIEPLKDLEGRGVRILACGTCLDYFQKKSLLRVGAVTNMFEILSRMTAAGHVVEP